MPDAASSAFSLLAVGTKAGKVVLWRCDAPAYKPRGLVRPESLAVMAVLPAHRSYVTAVAWAVVPAQLDGSPAGSCSSASGAQSGGPFGGVTA